MPAEDPQRSVTISSNNERDYGWGGRLGLGTPQGNPTVEAEARRLIPDSVEYFTVRLTSTSEDPRKRLLDYLEGLPEFMSRYAGLPLDAFLFACTGSSYLVADGTDREHAQRAADQLGAPVLLAADAIADWLADRNAARIALLSPYPDWLNEPATAYWLRRGFEIVARTQVDIGSDNTYGIYQQQSGAAAQLAGPLLESGADAFLISGTGMPSLPLIRDLQRAGRAVISSNLALMTAGLRLLGQRPTSSADWALRTGA